MDLCGDVLTSAMAHKWAEGRVSKGYIRPVNQEFISEWRDYEARYADLVDQAFFSFLFADISEGTPNRKSRIEIRWEAADDEAAEAASAIETAIEFARFNVEQTDRHSALGLDHVKEIELGIECWEDLNRTTQTDVRGILRRRRLVPIVFVTKRISDRIGDDAKPSVLAYLTQAQNSFIFGQKLAAIALLRSVAEFILRDIYKFPGEDLESMINNGAATLARMRNAANAESLHRLRRAANAILHQKTGPINLTNALEGKKAEIEVMTLLLSVRDLVEGAK